MDHYIQQVSAEFVCQDEQEHGKLLPPSQQMLRVPSMCACHKYYHSYQYKRGLQNQIDWFSYENFWKSAGIKIFSMEVVWWSNLVVMQENAWNKNRMIIRHIINRLFLLFVWEESNGVTHFVWNWTTGDFNVLVTWQSGMFLKSCISCSASFGIFYVIHPFYNEISTNSSSIRFF